MEYVRFRHDALGDISRIERQQKFLKAVAAKMMQPANWPKIPAIVAKSQEFVETDILPKDLLALARLAREIKPEQIVMDTLPGVPQNIGGISYWIPDEAKKAEVVSRILIAQASLGPKPNVAVLNGNGTTGIAAVAARKLRENGYPVLQTGNADNFNYECSKIIADAKDAEGAQDIARVLGCGSVVQATNGERGGPVVVILGRDFQPETR